MIKARLTRREYLETIAEHEQSQRMKRTTTKSKSGLIPFRRPVDALGRKIKGDAYRLWLEGVSENKED